MCNSGGIDTCSDQSDEETTPPTVEEELLVAQFLLMTSKGISMENTPGSMTPVDLENAQWTEVITGPFAAPVGILLRSELNGKSVVDCADDSNGVSTYKFLSLPPPDETMSRCQDAYLEESNLKIRSAWEDFLCRKSGMAH